MQPRFRVVELSSLPAEPCPCGTARRAFIDDEDQTASIHLVEIATDAKSHYHQSHTEIYYILEGSGHLELDGELVPVTAGTAVLIKPGCRHRAIGKLKLINIPIPAFDPSDECFD